MKIYRICQNSDYDDTNSLHNFLQEMHTYQSDYDASSNNSINLYNSWRSLDNIYKDKFSYKGDLKNLHRMGEKHLYQEGDDKFVFDRYKEVVSFTTSKNITDYLQEINWGNFYESGDDIKSYDGSVDTHKIREYIDKNFTDDSFEYNNNVGDDEGEVIFFNVHIFLSPSRQVLIIQERINEIEKQISKLNKNLLLLNNKELFLGSNKGQKIMNVFLNKYPEIGEQELYELIKRQYISGERGLSKGIENLHLSRTNLENMLEKY